jgi:hypothetical protein
VKIFSSFIFLSFFLLPISVKAQTPSQSITIENTTFIFSVSKGNLWERVKNMNTKETLFVTIIEDGKKVVQNESIYNPKLEKYMEIQTSEKDFFSLTEKEEANPEILQKIRTLSLSLRDSSFQLKCWMIFRPYGAKYAYKGDYCLGKCPLDAETINMAFHTISITKMELNPSP